MSLDLDVQNLDYVSIIRKARRQKTLMGKMYCVPLALDISNYEH